MLLFLRQPGMGTSPRWK